LSIASAVITAAGSSSRMGQGLKKEYRTLWKVPVLAKTIKVFQAIKTLKIVIVTVPQGHLTVVRNLLKPHINIEQLHIIQGGKTRQESVFKGLMALVPNNPDYVLIHDGARPWISSEFVTRILEYTIQYQACIPLVEVPDALKEIDNKARIIKHINKKWIKGAQTPQGFSFPRILKAHKKAQKSKKIYVDDAEVYSLLYKNIHTICGIEKNRKITYIHDLK